MPRRDRDSEPPDPDYHDRRRHHRRKGHRATDSEGHLLPLPTESRTRVRDGRIPESSSGDGGGSSNYTGGASSNKLSAASLAQLDKLNENKGWREFDARYVREVQGRERMLEEERVREIREREKEEKRRVKEAVRERERQAVREKRRQKEESRTMEDRIEEGRTREKEAQHHKRRREREERKRGYGDEYEYETGDGVREEYEYYRGVEIVQERGWQSDDGRRDRRKGYDELERDDRRRRRRSQDEEKGRRKKRKKTRVISGPLLEEGGTEEVYEYVAEKRGGAGSEELDDEEWRRRRRKRIYLFVAIVVTILAIAIPVGLLVSKKKSNAGESVAAANSQKPTNSELNGISKSDIPQSAQGTILDPFTWYDTTDFNVTYTDATVGGLSVMGLHSTWDDSVQANPNVPPLNEPFAYGTMPIRGMNVGGWLSIEPFITPSFFSSFNTRDNVIDEYTLTSALGPTRATQTLEKHYSAFVTAATFAEIRAAGFDHVRIPFSYWAVTTYPGDPYVPQISWRYLLRGIEYARQNGLRVNLDLHGAPGSQNGWNHSGRQGAIGWLNGTDGALNAQRTLDIHDQLSKFFAQPRYKNVVTMYGLVNEPRMVALDTSAVLSWTKAAIQRVRANNITAIIVFGDGFMGLDKWQGLLSTESSTLGPLLLDVHQYVIFNVDQIALPHADKVNFACGGWTAQTLRSSNTATGFGPTLCGEWSQADTDCAQYLNNVGVGSRWQGTLNTGNKSTAVLNPTCPTRNSPACSCDGANADPGSYSEAYKRWLRDFAEAQMQSFERGWGWFYWTWQTERAVQWSWRLGVKAGILPGKVWERGFSCNDTVPDYVRMGLPEYY